MIKFHFIISIVLMQIANVRTALMAQLMVGNYLLGNSVALILLSSARVVSPVVSGLMTVSHDIKMLVYFAGMVYLIAMVIAKTITLPGQSEFHNKSWELFKDLQEGFEQIRQDANLKFLTGIASLWRLFLGLQLSLFVVYITSYLAQNNSKYGLFMTTIALGSIFGSLARPLIIKRLKATTLSIWGLSIHYCTFAALGLINNYYTVLITAFVSYAAFYIALVGLGIKETSPVRTVAFHNLVPVISVLLGVLWLGEQVDARQILGALLVISGLILANRGSKDEKG